MSTVLRDAFSVTRFSFWTGVLLSSVVGTLAYLVTAGSIESDVRARFLNDAKYVQSVINVRVKSYTDLLRATRSMIKSSDVLTHSQFHEYVRGLEVPLNFPAVDYINFAVYVPEYRHKAFVSDMRADVAHILGKRTELDIRPPGPRPSYLVVRFIEPDAPSASLYGVDLMANPYFGTQLLEARDQDKLYAGGSPIAILSRPNNIYLGMRTPVYRSGTRLDTLEQRRAAYIGSLGVAISVSKLLHGVSDEMSDTACAMR